MIVQIGSTSLSLKETVSATSDTTLKNNISAINQIISNTPSSSQEVSVLDIIVSKSRALTSLQTRGTNLTLSAVTNVGSIAMDVPLRPQEVHDLVNRAGRLITSYVHEFLPNETQQLYTTSLPTNDELLERSANVNNIIQKSIRPVFPEMLSTGNGLNTGHKQELPQDSKANIPQVQPSISSKSKTPIFEVRITAHCQGMTFSTTLLSSLKAQYKIGVVECVGNLGSTTSLFTAIVHEHALHFLHNNNHNNNSNNNNTFHQLPTVSSDNHVRIDFPQIRCCGNYLIIEEREDRPKGHLNLRPKIDLLKLTITADFLAQLVFVSKVIIHEINEILAKVSGIDHFQVEPSNTLTNKKSSISSTDINYDDNNADVNKVDKQGETSAAPFTYKIDISIEGFEVMAQTPSNTIVRFENGDKKQPLLIKLTNYDEQYSFLLYKRPLINALLYIKLSLGQLLQTGSFQDAAYFKTKLLLRNSFQVSYD